MLFSKKIATMIRAGLPIIDSLEMTENQVVDKNMKKIISGIVQDLRGGFELSQCFAKHPKVFDNIYINMIKAGEASGKLDIFFDKLVEILEKRQKLKSQIKSALMYPVIIMCIALLITVFLLWKVVPVFEEMYGGMGVELPGPTKAIIAASDFIQGWGGLISLLSIIGFVMLFRFMMGASAGFKRSVDGMSLKLPIFGPVLAQSTISRIALIKANLFAAGVDVLEILDIATSSTSNTLYIEALERVKRGVFSGEDMSKLCANEKMFPDTYSQLIAVGERTGNLEEMFTSIANYYEEEFDNVVGNISTMIEPLSMVIIGGIVGVLLIAMYLPIFNAGSAIG
jgi:type IV pilus assembly protein PilC